MSTRAAAGMALEPETGTTKKGSQKVPNPSSATATGGSLTGVIVSDTTATLESTPSESLTV